MSEAQPGGGHGGGAPPSDSGGGAAPQDFEEKKIMVGCRGNEREKEDENDIL